MGENSWQIKNEDLKDKGVEHGLDTDTPEQQTNGERTNDITTQEGSLSEDSQQLVAKCVSVFESQQMLDVGMFVGTAFISAINKQDNPAEITKMVLISILENKKHDEKRCYLVVNQIMKSLVDFLYNKSNRKPHDFEFAKNVLVTLWKFSQEKLPDVCRINTINRNNISECLGYIENMNDRGVKNAYQRFNASQIDNYHNYGEDNLEYLRTIFSHMWRVKSNRYLDFENIAEVCEIYTKFRHYMEYVDNKEYTTIEKILLINDACSGEKYSSEYYLSGLKGILYKNLGISEIGQDFEYDEKNFEMIHKIRFMFGKIDNLISRYRKGKSEYSDYSSVHIFSRIVEKAFSILDQFTFTHEKEKLLDEFNEKLSVMASITSTSKELGLEIKLEDLEGIQILTKTGQEILERPEDLENKKTVIRKNYGERLGEYLSNEFEESLKKPTTTVVDVQYDNASAVFCRVEHGEHGEVYLASLNVDHQAQGADIGTLTIIHLLKERYPDTLIKAHAYPELGALPMYLEQGFVVEGIERLEDGDELFVIKRDPYAHYEEVSSIEVADKFDIRPVTERALKQGAKLIKIEKIETGLKLCFDKEVQ